MLLSHHSRMYHFISSHRFPFPPSQAIVDGLRESVLGFSSKVPGTSPKDVLDMVMLTQYFDTMRDIGAKNKASAIFIPHGPSAVGDVVSQIRNGFMQAQSAADATAAPLLNTME